MSTADADPQSLSDADTHAADDHGSHKASYDDINVSVILVVGFVSTVLTFVAIVGVQALYYYYENDEITRKEVEVIETPQKAISDEQKAKLMTYGHTIQQIDTVDGEKAEKTRITIPISEAMKQVIAQENTLQQVPSSEESNTSD